MASTMSRSQQFKMKMDKLQTETDEWNNKADKHEEELKRLEEAMIDKTEEQEELTIQCEETEKKIRTVDEKLKKITQQVNNAETFLAESASFRAFLTQNTSVTDENEIRVLTIRLEKEKEKLSEMERECREESKRKVKLSKQHEMAQNRWLEYRSKTDSLNLELEYKRVDEDRKSARLEKQQEEVIALEERMNMMEDSLEACVDREREAVQNVALLKQRIQDVETERKQMKWDCLAAQMKIKELKKSKKCAVKS